MEGCTSKCYMVLIAVEGCCHGELDNIYASIAQLEQVHDTKVDLLLVCGDFQAVRNQADLSTMACPPKYKDMRTFHKYYSGELVAPVLTVYIGGNHEASNHNWELYHGGWAAPNIYFLGYAGVINVGGVRIAGGSGIFNGRHYHMGHYEKPPYDRDTERSACTPTVRTLPPRPAYQSHELLTRPVQTTCAS